MQWKNWFRFKGQAVDYHIATSIFDLDPKQVEEITLDIQQRGQLVEIEYFDGKIVDGRCRWLACEKLGIKPKLKKVRTDDVLGYVISKNLRQRNFSLPQRAFIAAKAAELYSKSLKTRELVEVKVLPITSLGAATLRRARRILKRGTSDLIAAVKSGLISLNKADYICGRSVAAQIAAVQQAAAQRNGSANSVESENTRRGVGVFRAHEAIDCLKEIPLTDPLRARAYQIVKDWMRRHP